MGNGIVGISRGGKCMGAVFSEIAGSRNEIVGFCAYGGVNYMKNDPTGASRVGGGSPFF